jgi:ATP/maltotriose-dependent transcriptional regulator MalT
MWHMRGRYAEGREWLASFLDLPSVTELTDARAWALNASSHLASRQGDTDKARQFAREALRVSEALDNQFCQATARMLLADVDKLSGDLVSARNRYESALEIATAMGNAAAAGILRTDLADTLLQERKLEAAESLANTSLDVFTREQHPWGRLVALDILGSIATVRGQYARARRLLEEALQLGLEMDDSHGVVRALTHLGENALAQAHLKRARSVFVRAISTIERSGDRRWLPICLESLARAISKHEPVTAVRLVGAAELARQRQQARLLPREMSEREVWLNRVRQTIGARAYDGAWQAGRTLSPEQSIHLALSLDSDSRSRQQFDLFQPRPLTAREQEIAALVASGLTNAQIGERLVIAEGTVHRHLAHIRAKLGAHSRREVAAWFNTASGSSIDRMQNTPQDTPLSEGVLVGRRLW